MSHFLNDGRLTADLHATIGRKPDVQVAYDFSRPEVRLTVDGKYAIMEARSARQIAEALLRAADEADRNQR